MAPTSRMTPTPKMAPTPQNGPTPRIAHWPEHPKLSTLEMAKDPELPTLKLAGTLGMKGTPKIVHSQNGRVAGVDVTSEGRHS